jgi:hypothetical protein
MYSSINVSRAIKTRGMRWAGPVVRMGREKRCAQRLLGKPEKKTLAGSKHI